MQQILSITAIIMGLAVFVIGWPKQVYKNYKRKSTEGLSFPLFLLSFVTCAVWLLYGLKVHILMLIIPNIPAVIVGSIILLQFFLYREKKTSALYSGFPILLKVATLTQILAYLAPVCNWVIAAIGFPHQIWKNYKSKSTAGLSKWNFILWFAAQSVDEAYGLYIHNAPLIYGDIPAICFLSIILWQMSYYKKPRV